MSLYDVIKAVHVLAAIIWVGGNLTMNIVGTRVVRSGDGPRLAAFGKDASWLGTFVYLPSSIIVLAFGVWATIDRWSFAEWWVSVGLVGIVITAVTGSAVLGPESKRVGALVERKGPDDAEVKRRVGRLVSIARIDLVVLLIVVVSMVAGSTP